MKKYNKLKTWRKKIQKRADKMLYRLFKESYKPDTGNFIRSKEWWIRVEPRPETEEDFKLLFNTWKEEIKRQREEGTVKILEAVSDTKWMSKAIERHEKEIAESVIIPPYMLGVSPLRKIPALYELKKKNLTGINLLNSILKVLNGHKPSPVEEAFIDAIIYGKSRPIEEYMMNYKADLIEGNLKPMMRV